MKYVIEHKQGNFKLTNYNVKLEGLSIIPQNKNVSIKATKVMISDKKLTESYIKQRVNRKIDKIVNFMMRILNDDETSDEDSGMVLDELNRLKGIIINKYREHLTVSEYKNILTKLIIIEEEYKKNYNQKIYNNYMSNYYIEPTNDRSR